MHGSEYSVGVGVLDLVQHRHWRWGLLLAFAVSVLAGTVGYHDYLKPPHGEAIWGNALYHTAQLFFFHAPHFEHEVPLSLEVARWLAPMTTLLGLFGLGLRLLREEAQWRALRKARRHAIVCGLGRQGMALVRHLRRARHPVVVIEKNPLPDLAAASARLGALVLTGDATRTETLAEAGVERAAQLFAVCPEDAVNCEIAARASHLCSRRMGGLAPLECHIHLSDADLREVLQQSVGGHLDAGRMDLRFCDQFDPEVRRLLVQGLPLDHDGIRPEDPRTAHLVILGFGRFGRTLAVRAAQLGCFANGKRLRISVIDRRADEHREALLFRHPQIGQAADFQFHRQEGASPKTRELIEAWCGEPQTATSVVVCFDNEPLALELSLQLAPMLLGCSARLAVRLAGESGLANLLKQTPETGAGVAQVRAVGLEAQWCELLTEGGVTSDAFARRIHAEYERLTGASLAEPPGLIEAERARQQMERWLRQPEDFRESSRQQALHIYFKLRAIGWEAAPLGNPARQ